MLLDRDGVAWLSKDSTQLVEKAPEVERHSAVNGHQSPEMQLGTIFDPSWVPHTEH